MFKNYLEYIEYLKSLSDSKTSNFNKKLISTKFEILGIKLPDLRTIAKLIVKNNNQNLILKNQKFNYYEEILVYGFVLSQIKIDEN